LLLQRELALRYCLACHYFLRYYHSLVVLGSLSQGVYCHQHVTAAQSQAVLSDLLKQDLGQHVCGCFGELPAAAHSEVWRLVSPSPAPKTGLLAGYV
jgi:hypothetical protein